MSKKYVLYVTRERWDAMGQPYMKESYWTGHATESGRPQIGGREEAIEFDSAREAYAKAIEYSHLDCKHNLNAFRVGAR